MGVDRSDRPFRGFLPRKTTPRGPYQSTVIAKLSKRIVIVHVFAKKTQKTPRREIITALKRAKEIQ
jgi:phage-related protein